MMMNFNYFMMCSTNFLPFIMSLNLFNFFFLMLMMMMNLPSYIFIAISISNIILNIIFWFMLMNKEYINLGFESLNLEFSIKIFFLFFIISELMIFISMFWSYYSYMLVMDLDLGENFPAKYLMTFDWKEIPMINTFILLISSMTATYCHWFMMKKNTLGMLINLMLTIMLGLIFSSFQMLEYNNSYYSMNDSNYGSLFFFLTGLHGFHVMLGTLILIFSIFKIYNMEMELKKSESLEMGCWYWHFVDLIWLIVFYSLYFII